MTDSTHTIVDNTLEYKLTSNDTETALEIFGNGPMPNYRRYETPWKDYAGIVTKIVIHDGITRIGQNSFVLFKKLISIILADSVKVIGRYAFYRCVSINSTLCQWDGVETVKEGAFYFCNSPNFKSIPPNIKNIETLSFTCLKKTDYIYLPDSVKKIGLFSFGGCENLKKISIPNNIESIDGAPFVFAHHLTTKNIEIRNTNQESIKKSEIQIDHDKQSMYVNNRLIQFFYNKSNHGTTYIVPEKFTEIGAGAFYRAYGLSGIILPKNLKIIGYKAFGNTRCLKEITIPRGVSHIGEGLFFCENGGESNLHTAIINCDIDCIESTMFYNNSSLKYLILNGKINKISKDTFSYTNNLDVVYFKTKGTILESNAFSVKFMKEDKIINNNETQIDSEGLFLKMTDCKLHYIDLK